jgi:SAM-dependent methyltransferase
MAGMGSDAPIDRARALTFGSVATLYDQARPSYPEPLVDDIVALLPGRRVAEIGAGTGKATTKLAGRGLEITCVEPDPAMAEVLRARTATYPDVSVVVQPFEHWVPGAGFDGLVCAQAWHWMLPGSRMARAADALRPGGLLGLFWNDWEWGSRGVHQRISEVYAAHGMRDEAPTPPNAGSDAWPAREIRTHAAFGYLEVRRYRWSREYTAKSFTDYLRTISNHLALAPQPRERLLTEIAEVVDRHGDGRLPVDGYTNLYLGRRR